MIKFVSKFLALVSCFSLLSFAACFSQQKATSGAFNVPLNLKKDSYFEKTIVFKVKPQFRSRCSEDGISIASLKTILSELGIGKLYKMFPRHSPPAETRSQAGEEYVDLSLIYRFEYTSGVNIQKALNTIYNDGHVDYANPVYIPSINYYKPSDPRADTLNLFFQYHLKQIRAFNAWDIEKGDTNVVIGIVDNGSQWDHPDLAANAKKNYADPVNGTDDDNDGYIDNFHGWDLANNDNNPINDGPGVFAHGSHVAGDAAAVTDNGLEVASPGFKCKFLPVKVANVAGLLTKGFEGIVYAADHGCSIINCSWGQQGGALNYEQDIINYATINKNALVVAAAGNDQSDVAFYPASYRHVISVANVNSEDKKAFNSNYHYSVDVCAPGEHIYSTTYPSGYTQQSGTSMASPIAAGAAAIIKSHFPAYTADQVGERLRMTCDVIDTIATNSAFKTKLGRGRINMGNSLLPNVISVRYTKLAATDHNDSTFVIGDTIRIAPVFTNYLSPVSNLSVSLSSSSPYVHIMQGAFNAGALGTLDTISNFASIYEVQVLPTAPPNATIDFKLTYTGTGYSDAEWFSVIVNADYINVAVNDISTSVTSRGRIGYNALGQSQGLGFCYLNSPSLFFESSLMIGNSSSQVSDMTRGAPNGITDNDFGPIDVVKKLAVPLFSDFDLDGKFKDEPAGSNAMGIHVTHHCHAWTTAPDRKYVILEYIIKNNGTAALNSLYAGIFADWDIPNYNHNRVSYDASRKMGYAFSTDTGGLYVGIAVLTPGNGLHYAIDNVPSGGGGVDIFSTGYTTARKYETLSTNRTDAGAGGQGNDICDVVSTGPFVLTPGDSVKVAFAMLADTNLAGLQASADLALGKYSMLAAGEISSRNYSLYSFPNPATNTTTIQFSLPAAGYVSLDIYSAVGQRVKTLVQERLSPGNHAIQLSMNLWKEGIYFYRLTVDGHSETRKIAIIH